MHYLEAVAPAAARIIMGLFYWVMAAGLAKDFKIVTGLMAAKGVPAQPPLLVVTIGVWIVGGAALILGRGVIPSALVLLVLTAAVTPVMHNFWQAEPAMFASELQHFMKNIAIIAGLLALIAIEAAKAN